MRSLYWIMETTEMAVYRRSFAVRVPSEELQRLSVSLRRPLLTHHAVVCILISLNVI